MEDVINLLEQEKEYQKHPESFCEICREPFSDQYSSQQKITLECRHSFHYGCLQQHFFYSRRRHCPYCRHDADFLPLQQGQTPLQYVHREYYQGRKCQAIIKSGKRRGEMCGNNVYKNGAVTCGRHQGQG